MKQLEINDAHMYRLEEDSGGSLYLSVVCGGIGMYEVRLKLNDAEVARYKEGGSDYLRNLAYDVGKDVRRCSAPSSAS